MNEFRHLLHVTAQVSHGFHPRQPSDVLVIPSSLRLFSASGPELLSALEERRIAQAAWLVCSQARTSSGLAADIPRCVTRQVGDHEVAFTHRISPLLPRVSDRLRMRTAWSSKNDLEGVATETSTMEKFRSSLGPRLTLSVTSYSSPVDVFS